MSKKNRDGGAYTIHEVREVVVFNLSVHLNQHS